MSQRSTESIFNWSPLPKRKLFTGTSQTVNNETENDLYPNFDANVFLRSLEKEIDVPITGKVTGQIPQWLNGSLLRNGPGLMKFGETEFKHYFDGSALLHRFGIKDGTVTYQCRFVQTDTLKKNQGAGRIVVTEFGTSAVPDPCQSIFRRFASSFKMHKDTDNTLVSVYPIGDEIYAFSECPIIHQFNKITLEPGKQVNVGKYVTIVHQSAHPHITEDGSVYNLGLSHTKKGMVHNIVCFPAKKPGDGELAMFENARVVASIPARWSLNPSYMHSFGITENYFIIVEQPLSLYIPSVLFSKMNQKAIIGSFRWFKDKMVQFHVICKKTGKTAFKFCSETFFFMHIINQYELSDHIIIDICCYRDPNIIESMYIDSLRNIQNSPDSKKEFSVRPLRFILPLKPDKNSENLITLPNTTAEAYFLPNGKLYVRPEQLCNVNCEMPSIYYKQHSGKYYRYFYALNIDVDSLKPITIMKVDTYNKTSLTWGEENCYPSEPIFVPNPDCQAEDDGVILSAIIWEKEETKVGLLVLDARTFTEIGRVVFETAGPVPRCTHGWFAQNP